jgi:DNA-binding Lrp family transcriptional regulator
MNELLEILRRNCRESNENIAKMLNLTADEVEQKIADLEQKGVIRGYRAIIHEDRLNLNQVTALIEVQVTPERKDGFDHVARRIAEFPEVKSLHLVSGTFDLLLFIAGESLKEVAGFVSEKLAPMDGVTSTCSHFMLKTYKLHGVLMEPHEDYERLKISP